MTAPANSTTRDTAQVPAPFSYAQAAKGKPSATASKPPPEAAQNVSKAPGRVQTEGSLTMPEITNGSWADDAADAVTMVEEQAQGGARVEESSSSPHADAVTNSDANGDITPSTVLETEASRSTSTAKDDDAPSPNTPDLDELSWRRRSANKEEVLHGRRSAEAENPSSNEDREAEQTAPSPLVEAPKPTVNFWVQRAQTAKSKQTPPASLQTSPTNMSNGPAVTQPNTRRSSSVPSRENSFAKPTTVAGSQEKAPLTSSREARASSVSRGGQTRPSGGAGRDATTQAAQARQPSVSNASQFPSLKDSLLWPTPETAKDDDRRKTQSKVQENRENDKPASTASKGHKKNEWVSVPFVPSAKFETPMPPKAGRGARGGTRGGRGGPTRGDAVTGASSARGGRRPSASAESTRAAPSRDRSVSSVNRASSLPRSARFPNGETPQASAKRTSLPHELPETTATASTKDLRNGARDHTTQSPASSQVPSTNSLVPSTNADAANGSSASLEGPRHTFTRIGEGKPRRRGSRAADPDASAPRNGDRKRSGSLNSNPKAAWPERRPEGFSRQYEPSKDPGNFLPFRERGEGRSDRGRGGRARGAFYHPQAPSNLQVNNGSNYYPATPHSAKSATFNGSFASGPSYQRGGRGGGNGGAPRSASIPSDVTFGQFKVPYASSSYLAQPQYSSPGSFDNGPLTPSSAGMPVNNYMNMMLMNGVAAQLSYYFSVDNLCKDMFLRERMDSQGFVSLRLISDFQRMRSMTADFDLIKFVAQQNPELEVFHSTNNDLLVRRREGWPSFVLAMNQRDPSAQNDGPTLPQYFTSPTHINGYDHGRDFQSLQPMQNGQFPEFTPVPTASTMNGYPKSPNNRYSMSAIDTTVNFAPAGQAQSQATGQPQHGAEQDMEDEPDAYPDEKIDNQLTILTRLRVDQIPHPHVTRSFSNGTIDGGFLTPRTNGEERRSRSPVQGNGSESSDHTAKLAEIKEKLSSPVPAHRASSSRAPSSTVFWIKDQNEAVEHPPNAELVSYAQVCANAKQQRRNAEPGQCPEDMGLLYDFWSHFLLRNFNRKMYNDFRFFAIDDAKNGSQIGLTHLLEYYDKALFSQDRPIRRNVASDYVEQARNESEQGEGTIFRRLRAAWRNGEMNFKSRKILQDFMDADLKSSLDR